MRLLTIIDPSYGPHNAQVSAESRSEGWRDGVKLWREHPILGVGPGNFGLGRGYDLQAHQLYGQVLGELGTLGAIAFLSLVGAFFLNYLDLRRNCRQLPELWKSFLGLVVLAVTFTVVLLLLMGFGGHNLYRYTWLWYGAFQAIALQQLTIRYSVEDYQLPLSTVECEKYLQADLLT